MASKLIIIVELIHLDFFYNSTELIIILILIDNFYI